MNMKNNNQILTIIRKWWEYNQTMAQLPEAHYFETQIRNWESGFSTHLEGDYSPNECGFNVISVKDIKEGLSIHIEGSSILKGILNTKTGEWIGRGNPTDTETNIMRGASIDG